MGISYAAVNDITALGNTLSSQQTEAAKVLLSAASAKLRVIAKKYGKNLDDMCKDEDMKIVIKNTVIQSVMRALTSMENSASAISQASQSALGYSASVTYVNAGQSLYFLRNELKELGLMRQRFGALEVYSYESDKRS